MNKRNSSMLWGIILVVAGVIFLLQSLGIVEDIGPLVFAPIFGVAGLAFVMVYLRNKDNWWALIPGFGLLGLATLMLLDMFLPRFSDMIGPAIVLGALSASFLVIYATERENWWAIIPCGTLATLSVITVLDELAPGFDAGLLIFIGLGITFFGVALTPTTGASRRWALIPGGVLTVFGAILLAESMATFAYVWPAVLIIVGGYMVYKTMGNRSQDE